MGFDMMPTAQTTNPSQGQDDTVSQSVCLFEPRTDSHLAAGAKRLLRTNPSY